MPYECNIPLKLIVFKERLKVMQMQDDANAKLQNNDNATHVHMSTEIHGLLSRRVLMMVYLHAICSLSVV